MTLRYRDGIDWKSSKIISRLVSVGLFALRRPQHHGSTPREQPEILAGIGEGYRKSGFLRTKALISLKRGKIGPSTVSIEDK